MDFVTYLQKELFNRCRKNKNYSLRAFAKALNISPGALSQILNRNRPLTAQMQSRLGQELNLEENFMAQFDVQHFRDYEVIENKDFEKISDWYHYAILELIKVKDFKPDAEWVSRCIDLPINQTEKAIESLFELGLIERNGTEWVDPFDPERTVEFSPGPDHLKSLERKKQIFGQALENLMRTSQPHQFHKTLTVAISQSDLGKLEKKVSEFIVDVNEMLEAAPAKDEVYHLTFSAFPVSKASDVAD